MCRQNKLRWNVLRDANRNLYRLYYDKEIERDWWREKEKVRSGGKKGERERKKGKIFN